jgi:sigma-B regulation protein RsbU (phosphoserine phosphatase)
VRRLDVGGTILGPIPTARYEGARVRLEAGDTLILYKDGISERRNAAGEFLGVKRVERPVTGLKGQSAKAIAAAVIAAADAFAEGLAAQDDMTVVVVRRS